MVLPVAFALMAAGGYRKYRQDQADEARQAKIDADAEEERAFRKSERERLTTMRKDVSEASQPVAVEQPWQPAVDDEGNAMPQGSPYRVGMRRFDDKGAAEAEAVTQNTPKARTARMSAALEKHGEIDKAAVVRSNARQEELADLQLDATKKKLLNDAYDRSLSTARTHDQLAQFVSDSMGDGQGGAVKVKAVPSADGKTVTYHQINPDGTSSPTPYTFGADFNGVAQAAFTLSRGVSAKDKLDHMLGQAKTEEERRRWQDEFGLRKDEAARRAKHDAAMLANDSARVGIARMSAETDRRKADAAAAGAGAPLWDDDADKFLRQRYTVTDPTTGAVSVDGNGLQFAKLVALGQAQSTGGDTTRAVGFAFEQDNRMRAMATDAKGNYDQRKHEGLRHQYLAELQKPTAAPVAPGAAPARTAPPQAAAAPSAAAGAPTMRTPTQPASATPPVKGEQPTGAQQFADFLAKNITTPQGKAQIGAVIRQRLPAIQAEIERATNMMAMPLVTGPVKAQLKQKVDALAQEAQMMQEYAAQQPASRSDGLVGLSEIALARIAGDRRHPNQAEAAAILERAGEARNAMTEQRMREADTLAPY